MFAVIITMDFTTAVLAVLRAEADAAALAVERRTRSSRGRIAGIDVAPPDRRRPGATPPAGVCHRSHKDDSVDYEATRNSSNVAIVLRCSLDRSLHRG